MDYDVGFDDAGKVVALALKVYMEVSGRVRFCLCHFLCVRLMMWSWGLMWHPDTRTRTPPHTGTHHVLHTP